MDFLKLHNKKILVTGATGGIGSAVCILLSRCGANVIMTGRNQNKLEELCNMMGEGKYNWIAADLADFDNIEMIFKKVIEFDGNKLDGMVNCAGISVDRPLKTINYEIMENVMKINYFSFIELVKYYSLKKYSNGGSIVTISSNVVNTAGKCQTVYAASKAAMDISVRTLSKELISKGIRINSIQPTFVDTPIFDRFITSVNKSKEEMYSIKCIAKPIDVANFIAFILSDVSKFNTGNIIKMDGGNF